MPLIIILNVFVYLLWLNIEEPKGFMDDNFTVSWTLLMEGRYWVLLTSVFSHNWALHLFINMFVLNSFGNLLVQVLGWAPFLRFYLAAGIVSSFVHALVSAFVVGAPDVRAVGASGAIAGLILVFSLLFPRERILLFGIIPLPAIFGALAFVALDLWGLYAQAGGGGLPIGHGAHLGGAAAGFFYFLFVLRPRLKRGTLRGTF